MTRISATLSNVQSIHAALELSKNRWLLAIQVPGRVKPSLYPIKSGDGGDKGNDEASNDTAPVHDYGGKEDGDEATIP